MRRLNSNTPRNPHATGDIAVDADVPSGFAHLCYEIGGFNTAYNPLATEVNGRRIQQTCLPIVFHSGLEKDQDDGVRVEDLLTVCNDHLSTRKQTLDNDEASAEASALIHKAIALLVSRQAPKE